MSATVETASPGPGRLVAARIWNFAGCELGERGLELKVAGQLAPIERKPLEVLLHLLRHAGEVVTKDELVEAIWPGRIISDSNLTKTVAVLRAVLGEAGQSAIKTVHGYGYRLVAPVSIRSESAAVLPARFDFKPGEPVPLRPDWQLARKLGAGSHGEVWLAQHKGGGGARVFKFATEGLALTALKREVTLSRLLSELLPDRDDYLRLLGWNLDEPPFFVESDYAPRGNLLDWFGGAAVPALEQRLELLARIADALAAAHSVGVLHKDLKPANVLILEADGGPRIRLADFGSGGVLNSEALEALGITRLGFTQTVAPGRESLATALYLAPEVMAGQPFTVQSDLYSLGVMLYQLVVGDFRRPLAPGWEKDVADEQLREDIASAVAGRPADRLRDAATLAQRVRTLPARRQQAEHERTRQAEHERSVRLRQDFRRLRMAAALMLVLALAAIAGGVVALRARDAARQSALTAVAVNDFLNRDLLANADPARGPTRDLTVRQLLDRAAESIQLKLKDQPVAAAQVHGTLGQAYHGVGELERARSHLEQSAALLADEFGPQSEQRLRALRPLPDVLMRLGQQQEGCALAEEIRDGFLPLVSANDAELLSLRSMIAGCLLNQPARQDQALAEFQAVAHALERAGRTRDAMYAGALGAIASARFNRGELPEAEAAARRSLAAAVELHGAAHLESTQRRTFLALCLISSGQLAAGEQELFQALDDQKKWVGDTSADIGAHTVLVSLLRLEQGRSAEALRAAREFLDSPLGRQIGSGYKPAALTLLSESLLLQGQEGEALRTAQQAIEVSQALGMPVQAHQLHARAFWAEVLLASARPAEAGKVLDAVMADELEQVPPQDPGLARYRRAQGLLLRARGNEARAQAVLRQSFEAYQRRYGDDHWRTRRARDELGAVSLSG